MTDHNTAPALLVHEWANDLSASATADDVLLTSGQLRRRWGRCSAMLIWRRLKFDTDMPRPSFYMHRRRYWYLSRIVAYERVLAKRSAKPHAAAPTGGA